MTDPVDDETPELEPARGFDSARLIGLVRRGDETAIGEAYRLTFGSELGRIVLLHALTSIGEVGLARGAETPGESNHKNGRGYAVMKIAGLAGFDAVAIAAAGMTQILEGADYEHAYGNAHIYAGNPAVAFSDADAEPDAFTGGAADTVGSTFADPN